MSICVYIRKVIHQQHFPTVKKTPIEKTVFRFSVVNLLSVFSFEFLIDEAWVES